MSDLVKKWGSMMDIYDCHPEMRERIAVKLERILRVAQFESNNGSFDSKKFDNKIKKVIEPYDRRENTVG